MTNLKKKNTACKKETNLGANKHKKRQDMFIKNTFLSMLN